MNFIKALKSIFNTSKEKGLRFSDIKLGEDCNVYREYLRHRLGFEPIIKPKKNQIVFFNVVFEKIKFENFAFEIEGTENHEKVKAVYLISTYEHKEHAQAKFEFVRKVYSDKYSVESQSENLPECYYPPVYFFDCKQPGLVVSLGMTKLAKDDFAYDNYAVTLALKSDREL